MNLDPAAAPGARSGADPVARLPAHLRQHLVPQEYERYTAQDHAVWRYILRQSVRLHAERAHPIYLEGLRRTGIDTERIPRIEEMNEKLGRLGWAAATVDGFIPPSAFMEFQAHRVLVIAADMRQAGHLAYTPAPDIVHEAAGHAPIIADPHYAEYLCRIGEVGARAMASRADLELYEAIRRLSIVKEQPDAAPEQVACAEAEVQERQQSLGAASEMALISRLHWWTVEYGLVGTRERPLLYGAGLLSSLGEAVSCLGPQVEKLPYTVAAAEVRYDITRPQPQLFVTPDFDHLSVVLEELARGFAFRVGGVSGLQKAVESGNVATAQWSSGLQVSGVFQPPRLDSRGELAWVRTAGPTALALAGQQLSAHGRDYHREGFSAPVGRLAGVSGPPEELDDGALARLGVVVGRVARLEFESGVVVQGHVFQVDRRGGKVLLVRLVDCRVTWGEEVLFQPEWGAFDLPLGERVVSVFSGAADQDAYEQVALVSRHRTEKRTLDGQGRGLHDLYAQVRRVREGGEAPGTLAAVWRTLQRQYPDDWIVPLEILEVVAERGTEPALAQELREFLALRGRDPGVGRLVADGVALAAS